MTTFQTTMIYIGLGVMLLVAILSLNSMYALGKKHGAARERLKARFARLDVVADARHAMIKASIVKSHARVNGRKFDPDGDLP